MARRTFRDRAIPPSDVASTADYREVRVAFDSKYQREPLVTLADYGVFTDPYYARTDSLNPPYYRAVAGASPVLQARREVARRLAAVNRKLAAVGVELLVLDAHRSIQCQSGLWDFFIAHAKRTLATTSTAAIERHALQYCSDPRKFDPSDPRTWPSHVTGGAVDVTLKRVDGLGEPLFMGGIFDDPSDISKTAFFEEVQMGVGNASDAEARANRRLLYWAMARAGFANLPTEWWHYDWGTQLWALLEGGRRRRSTAAVYGPA